MISINENVTSGEFDSRTALRLITANNIIRSGGSAEYNAGETIILSTGFNAQPGATFNAFIEGCSSSTRSGKSLEPQEVTSEDVFVENTTTTEGLIVNNTVTIYPNPTDGLFNVQGANKFISYAIQNMLGEQIMFNEVNENNLTIDILKFTSGIYFLELETENGEIIRKKILKN